MAFADYTSRGAVAVIALKNPPVNALSLGLRTAIMDCLERATTDESTCRLDNQRSAGGHELQPSEVKSSTTVGRKSDCE